MTIHRIKHNQTLFPRPPSPKPHEAFPPTDRHHAAGCHPAEGCATWAGCLLRRETMAYHGVSGRLQGFFGAKIEETWRTQIQNYPHPKYLEVRSPSPNRCGKRVVERFVRSSRPVSCFPTVWQMQVMYPKDYDKSLMTEDADDGHWNVVEYHLFLKDDWMILRTSLKNNRWFYDLQ